MAINRIDFQGAFIRTSDVSQLKQGEDSRLVANQNAFQAEFTKESERRTTSVTETTQTEQQESKFDAKEKGKNEYYKKKEEKRKDGEDKEGSVIDLTGKRVAPGLVQSAFDLKI